MVTTNLSQNRATQRLLKNRLAVITLARQAAIKTVKRQLQAQGIKSGASFRSLGDPWCDTTSAHGKLMVTVLGGLAEFERHLILARTTEGRKRAQARGVRFGRKLKLTAHQRQEAIARREAGEALVDIARSYNVSHSTISRLGAVFTASHNHKLLPRPLNAIIDLGNTNPDRVGAHRGMGTDGSGPGSHIHENRSRFYTSDDLKIVKYLLTKRGCG